MTDLNSILAAIHDLFDSADQTGCTLDLTVVETQALMDLADAAGIPRPTHICTQEEVD